MNVADKKAEVVDTAEVDVEAGVEDESAEESVGQHIGHCA